MSANGDLKPTPKPWGMIRKGLSYSGIPSRWLDKRPTLPSRNWLIFLTTTSTITGYYIYDRQQCKKIKREYTERVKHLAEVPLDALDRPRKITVYGAKWPGDEDYDQSLKYFRKYVKPILVAAAVDYEMINGKRHGDLARRIAEDIKARRRLDAGIDQPSPYTLALPTRLPREEELQRELAGGIVIVGRPAFKEFMAGLHKGWTESLKREDPEEDLAQILAHDGCFDEPEEPTDGGPQETAASQPSIPILISPLQFNTSKAPNRPQEAMSFSEPAASAIPPVPPLLLVPFIDFIGFRQIPLMLWDFFNQRQKVQAGARAAYSLIMGHTRPFKSASAETRLFADITNPDDNPGSSSDVDFDKGAESYYNNSTSSIPTNIEKARTKYYDDLLPKLVTARALARGEREYTKEETESPPPTEVELRAERLKKELRWRRDLDGWAIVKPQSEVVWDERLGDVLRVFTDPPADAEVDSVTI